MRAGSPVLVLVLSLTILTAVPNSGLQEARAVSQAGPTTWSPFGPRTQNLSISVYSDYVAMFSAFLSGQIDLTDWPVNPIDEPAYENNPDIWISNPVTESGIFELDINHHNTFMGIPFQENRGSDAFNSPSTRQPTSAGVEIRRALAHLLDKPSFLQGAQLQGRADYDDIQSSPPQGLTIGGASPSKLPQSILDEDCSAHPWFNPGSCHPVSAYNLVADNLADPYHSFANLGWAGRDDLRAACDHLVLAGFAITPSSASCADVATANGGAHVVPTGFVNFYIRSHVPRKAFGTIARDGLNFLFGTPGANNPDCVILQGTSCSESYFTITEVVDIVFRTEPDRDDWHLYTGGWTTGPESALYAIYHSSFASSACGGKKANFAQNYHFYCNPAFDEEAAAGEFSTTLTDSKLHFENAALVGHRTVMTVPVYSGKNVRFAALNGWNWQPGTESSLVLPAFYGFQWAYWSLLNMRARPSSLIICDSSSQPPGCTHNSRYLPGGGNPNLIRRGISQDVHRLSPFHALTNWDLEVLEQVYDSMLKDNPLTGGAGAQPIDWMTLRHSTSFDPTTKITTQTWTLRNDLKWHDGTPVTAEDIAYSILAYRDVPSVTYSPSVSSVISASALDPRTAQVKLTGQSRFHESYVGSVPIIPKHIWAPLCGDPPSSSSICADPTFDPMAAGIYIGSGPWVCNNLQTGTVGGSCTQPACPADACATGGQEVLTGGKILLTRYDGYMRSVVPEGSLHKFSWADVNNDAVVNILDIASAALKFGLPDPYWNTGENPLAPNVGADAARVDIAELATVAVYFDQSLTRPYSPSTLVGLDPDIDPFF